MKTEDLKNTVNALNDYFVEKLVNSDYKIVDRGEHMVKVDISGYEFNIWIANDDWGVRTYGEGFVGNFMQLNFDKRQRKIIYKNLMSDNEIDKLMSEIEIKKNELNQLKSKLKNL